MDNYNYAVLNDARLGIVFCQKLQNTGSDEYQFVAAGRYAQVIFRKALQIEHKIGFCPVGGFDQTFLGIINSVTNGDPVCYGLLGGHIAPCQLSEQSYSVARDRYIVLAENITKYLEAHLPHYMIPKSIKVIKKITG